MSWAARGPPRRSGEALPVGAVERLEGRSRQRRVLMSRRGCAVRCECHAGRTRRHASRAGVARVAVEVSGESARRVVGQVLLWPVRGMVVHVVPEVRGVGGRLVLAVDRRHSPGSLEREQAQQNEGDKTTHGGPILGTGWYRPARRGHWSRRR
jgi:hypothetical protein